MNERVCAALVVLCATASLMACATTSTSGDFSTVRALVEQRADLRVIERDPERFEQPEADAEPLLAQALTAESAVRVALLNNRDLRAELQELGIARGALVQASLVPNPDFEAGVRFPQGGDHEGAQWDLGLGFDVTRALLAPKRVGIAEAELEATRYRVAGRVLDLTYRVQLAFRAVQAQQQLVELQQTTLRALTASYDAARALAEVGNLPALDLATEQAAYEQARISVTEAEADLLDARERLNLLLGVFGADTQWQVVALLPDPVELSAPPDGLEAKAIETSLELAEARAQLTAQARSVGLAEATGWIPDLNIGMHAEHDGEVWEVGPVLTGTLPVFDRQQGRAQSLRSQFWAVRERYVATAVSIRAAVRIARNRLQSAEARARHYRTVILPLRERVVAETVREYNAMQIGVFQLLQARRDQIAAASAYIETLREYWQARAALDQLLAGRLTGTIEEVVSDRRTRSLATQTTDGQH